MREIVIQADLGIVAVCSPSTLELFVKAFINILVHLFALFVMSFGFCVVLYLKDISTDCWVAETFVKAVIEAYFSIFASVVRLTGVALCEALILLNDNIIFFEMLIDLRFLVAGLCFLVEGKDFLVDFLHSYV